MFVQHFWTFDSIEVTFSCVSDVIITSEFIFIFIVISDSVKLFLLLIEVVNLCHTHHIKLSFDCSAWIAHLSYSTDIFV